jgi:hypothetical protein
LALAQPRRWTRGHQHSRYLGLSVQVSRYAPRSGNRRQLLVVDGSEVLPCVGFDRAQVEVEDAFHDRSPVVVVRSLLAALPLRDVTGGHAAVPAAASVTRTKDYGKLTVRDLLKYYLTLWRARRRLRKSRRPTRARR